MHHRFIAIVLAISLAVTGWATAPAQAGSDDDVAKWIAGLAALAIIGAAVADHEKDKKRKRAQTHHYNWNGQKSVNRVYRSNNRFLLPGRCRLQANLQGNTIRGFARGCLRRNNVNVDALPRQCAVRFLDRSRDRRVTLYTGRCLRQFGYRVAQH